MMMMTKVMIIKGWVFERKKNNRKISGRNDYERKFFCFIIGQKRLWKREFVCFKFKKIKLVFKINTKIIKKLIHTILLLFLHKKIKFHKNTLSS